MIQSTLCYIERAGQYLMLHRVKKENDLNHDKWVGVGGKFLDKESPEECLLREVKEETGLTLTDYRFRATGFEGEMIVCDEGDLEWVEHDKITDLPIWEGDKLFLRLLAEEAPFFSLKLEYYGDTLVYAALDGKEIKLQKNEK